MFRLIHLARCLKLVVADMPAHVNHEDIKRNIVLAETAHQFIQFLIGVIPIPRPPRAECKARRQRNAPRDLHVIAQRLAVVVAVAEEV